MLINLIKTNNMKMKMMTLAAVFCCAMGLTMFTACGSDDDDDKVQVDSNTPVAAVMEYGFEVSDDMLTVLDMTVEYYDNDGKLQKENLTQKKWVKTVKAKLPVSLGACLKAQLKDGVDVNTIEAIKVSRGYKCTAYSMTATSNIAGNVESSSNNATLTVNGEKLTSLLSDKNGILISYLYDFADNGKVVAGSWK